MTDIGVQVNVHHKPQQKTRTRVATLMAERASELHDFQAAFTGLMTKVFI